MMRQLVITAVGADRPGLVDRLTGYLLDHRANLADARMVNMRGQFAVIMLAEVPDESLAAVRDGVVAAGRAIGLTVSVATAAESSDTTPTSQIRPGVPFRLRTYAMDQPGIVHRVTHLLHRHGANIEELTTHLEAGSYTGTPLFTMDLRMTVPTQVAVKQLRAELQELCDALNCDVDLEPA